MSEHKATVSWRHARGDFIKGTYSREHTWSFDGGLTLAASPSPSLVPTPYSNPAGVDPEEAYVAAISSCHMLTFLYLASNAGVDVLSYTDTAVGVMEKNAAGVFWVSKVLLDPTIEFAADNAPTADELLHLHHEAHEQCFIANSIRTEVSVIQKLEGN